MNSVVSINERAVSIALKAPSNLVELLRVPDVGTSLAQTPTSSNPPSRNQRCFPQVNRKINCFDGGLVVTQQALWVPRPYLALKRSQATFKAVCGTQTRMPEGFNLMCNQTQALSTPDNLVGGASNSRPYLMMDGKSSDLPEMG